jgi:hypothetical protein
MLDRWAEPPRAGVTKEICLGHPKKSAIKIMLHPRNFNRGRGFNLSNTRWPLNDKAVSKNNTKRKPNKFMVLTTSTLLNYAQLISQATG